ncbi:MAG: copper-binding protein [Burkholderiaceae bacterium]|nr:MAG: copper-binding protein [Burkholderiaceae bacterium]MCC7288632.1 copper-binding protein [Burkholderiaceae bacterium]
MNPLLISTLLAAVLATPVAAQAQQQAADHGAHHRADLTNGEVRKVDKEAAKVTIKHGEIRNLDMPPMTMVFRVKDATLLDKLKAGDQVRFRAEKDAGGALVVSAIEAAR